MNSRFYQLIGWVSIILALAVVGAADQGALSAAGILWGGMLGTCGLLLALFGQCAAIARARREAVRLQRIPIEISERPTHRARRHYRG